MNLHSIQIYPNEILYWVAPGGRHRPCRYPQEGVRNHHECCSDRELRHRVIYCECPVCYETGFAHYIDNSTTRNPNNGSYWDSYYCTACNNGHHPTPPPVDSEGYPA